MVQMHALNEAVFIAAPVKILEQNSLLAIFQVLDFITMQGVTGASVYKRIYSMCNGANLAYEKQAFYSVNGFEGIDKIASGDDMLLMQKIFKQFPMRVFFLKSPAAIVATEPANSWRQFLHQRIRWASKADKYDDPKIFWTLSFIFFLNFSLLAFLIVAFWNPVWLIFFLVLVLIKGIIEFPFVSGVAGFFQQEKLMKYFFFLEPLHILYIVVAGTMGKFGGYEWKERKIHS